MAFIPRTSSAPAPRTFRVTEAQSHRPVLALLLLLFPIAFYGWDFTQSIRHTGLYRQEWAGEVVSARPTILSIGDWLMTPRRSRYSSYSSRHWNDSRNVGHFVLKIRTDEGKVLDVGVSSNEYNATLVPGYVVGAGSGVRHFKTRLDAVRAGAVPRQPGDPE